MGNQAAFFVILFISFNYQNNFNVNLFVDFFLLIIRLFREKRFVYLVLTKNKIEITHLKSGRTIAYHSDQPFSTDRLLIADNVFAENLGRAMMKNLCGKDLTMRAVWVLIHPMELGFHEISLVEKMIYNDFSKMIGASGVVIVDSDKKLEGSELNNIIKKYTKNRLK